MPVLSPRRSSASALGPSYRSTFNSSNLDRPYCSSSNSYLPRINSYSERFTSRSYIDGDGRRVYTRQGSITEDGVTTRFKEEMREGSVRRESVSRDSGISSIRENSILDTPRRESSLTRNSDRPRISAISVAESVAEMRNKYSPSNYVPACLRNNDNITRSKSINDIGKPPATTNNEAKTNSTKSKVNGGFNYSSNGLLGVTNLSNSTNNGLDDNVTINEDDNGNRTASVAEIRKKFDQNIPYHRSSSKTTENLAIEGVKISENRFKKRDSLDGNNTTTSTPAAVTNKPKLSSSNKKKPTTDLVTAINNKKNDMTNGHVVKKNKTEIKKPSSNIKEQSALEKQKNNANNVTVSSSGENLLSHNNSDSAVENDNTKLTVVDDTKCTQNGHEINNIQNATTETENVNNEPVLSDNTEEFSRNFNHTTNFASYIPSKNALALKQQQQQQGDSKQEGEESPEKGEEDEQQESSGSSSSISNSIETPTNTLNSHGNDMENRNYIGGENRYYSNKDITTTTTTTSPRLNRTISQNAGASNNYQRAINSVEREEKLYERTRGASPIKNLGLNGLKNIGNTCFMNSVIQCLSNTKLLLEYVKNDLYVSDINTTISGMKGALIKAFSQVIKELWSEDSSDRVVNTLSLKSQIQRFAPRFMGYSQQDAQEFLRYLLEGLHEDVNRVTSKPTPILTEIDEKLSDNEKSSEAWQRYLRMDNSKVVDIFVGQLKSTLRCTHCGHCSVTFDPFWDLSLPIPQRAGQLRLQQCLDYFTREETLDGDEKPTCSRCKERRKCTKSFTIQKFPKILVIHLKRFSPTERFRGKLSVTIDFPLEGLDMRNYAAESSPAECRYNLYAISNHSGTTYSGHYTAYCRHPYSRAWHEYNDSRVSGISPKAIVSGEAYVLFYELDNQKSHL